MLPLPPEDQQKVTDNLGPGVVGNALPSKPIQDASVYFPLRDKVLTYQITVGPDAGTTQTFGLAKVARFGEKLAWRFQISPSLAGFIRQTPGGDLIMPVVTDAREGVVVFTTPANPFVLNGMKPGETRSYSQQVSVYALDDPADQEYSGSLNGTYTYVGSYQYRLVRIRRSCSVSNARARSVQPTRRTRHTTFSRRVRA